MDAKPYTAEQSREITERYPNASGTLCLDAAKLIATLREYAAMKEAMEEIADHAADPHRCSCTVWGDCLDAIESIARRFVDTRGEG